MQVSIDDLDSSASDRGRVQELADNEGIVVCARRVFSGNLIHLDSSLAHEARAVVDMTADDLTAESSRDRVRHRLRYSLGPERTIVKVRGLRANRSNEHRIGWLCAARLAVLVTAVAAFGCGRAEQAEKPFEGPSEEWRGQIAPSDLNIVLVTIDTLRTDRVSSYGSDLVDTPNIDGFASEGVLF